MKFIEIKSFILWHVSQTVRRIKCAYYGYTLLRCLWDVRSTIACKEGKLTWNEKRALEIINEEICFKRHL